MKTAVRIGLVFDTRFAWARGEVSGVIAYARSLKLPWIFAGGDDAPSTWRMLRRWKPAGIVGAIPPKSMRHIPWVVPLTPDRAGVTVLDNAAIGQLAAEHLLERGFRHLAFVGEKNATYSAARAAGFMKCLKLGQNNPMSTTFHQIELPPSGVDDWRPVDPKLVDWLKTLPRPIGILACRDLRAREVAQACRAAHIQVPEQAAIIGVDNDELLCELTAPPLSSIRVPWQQIGYHMGAQLHCHLQGRPWEKPLLPIAPNGIHIRHSSDIYAVADDVVAKICHHIQIHSHEPLLVGNLAQTAGISRRGLERRFRRELGRSPHAEIQRLRLKHAQKLLRETSLPMKAIAEQSGWSSVQRFMAIFKAKTGKTPGQFRASEKFIPLAEEAAPPAS